MASLAPAPDPPTGSLLVERLVQGLELVFLTAAMLLAVGLVLLAILPDDPRVMGEAEIARYVLRDKLYPEPTERLVCAALAMLAPILALALPRALSRGSMARRRMRFSAGFVAFLGCFSAVVFYYQRAGALIFGKALFAPPAHVVVLALAAAGAMFVRNRLGTAARIAAGMAFALVIAVIAIPQRTVLPVAIRGEIAHGWHLETVLWPIVQTNAGARCLVDYAPQYGCYAEWLKPLLHVVGQGIGAVTAAFAWLHAIGWIVALIALVAILRSTVVAVSLALVMAVLYGCSGFAGHTLDPYIEYAPLRTLVPLLSVGAVVGWMRKPTDARTLALSCAIGLGATWNLDAGLATMVAWLGLLGFDAVTTWTRIRRVGVAMRPVIVAVAGMAFALVLVIAWLVVRGGGPSDLAALGAMHAAVIRDGYYQVPMPGLCHPWPIVALVYAAGLVAGGLRAAGATDDSRDRVAVFASLLGIGLFSYFQGRSMFLNLVSVMWPAFVVYALLIDRIAVAAGAERRERVVTAVLAFPITLVGALALGMAAFGAPNVAETWSVRQDERAASAASPIARQAAFVRESAGGAPALVVSVHQAVIHAESGVRPPWYGPGLGEMLLVESNREVARRIASGAVDHVFVGRQLSFLGNREMLLPPDDVLARNYTFAGADPTSSLLHFVRRGTSAGPAPR
jgi:hypothetical protein